MHFWYRIWSYYHWNLQKMATPINLICMLSLKCNNRPPAWLSGISGHRKQVYYKSWPYCYCYRMVYRLWQSPSMKDVQLLPFFSFIRVVISTLLKRYGPWLPVKAHQYYDILLQTGWNPLIRASTEGNLKLVKIIADRGGQLNSVTMVGTSHNIIMIVCYLQVPIVIICIYSEPLLEFRLSLQCHPV